YSVTSFERWRATAAKPIDWNSAPSACGSGAVYSTNSKPSVPIGLTASIAAGSAICCRVPIAYSPPPGWSSGRRPGRVIAPGTAVQQAISRQELARLQVVERRHALVERHEVDLGEMQQLLDIAHDEVALLEVVDAIAGAHDPLQVEGDAVRRLVVEGEDGLAVGRGNAGAVDLET